MLKLDMPRSLMKQYVLPDSSSFRDSINEYDLYTKIVELYKKTGLEKRIEPENRRNTSRHKISYYTTVKLECIRREDLSEKMIIQLLHDYFEFEIPVRGSEFD